MQLMFIEHLLCTNEKKKSGGHTGGVTCMVVE